MIIFIIKEKEVYLDKREPVGSGYVAISGGWAWIFFMSFNLWTVLIIMKY